MYQVLTFRAGSASLGVWVEARRSTCGCARKASTGGHHPAREVEPGDVGRRQQLLHAHHAQDSSSVPMPGKNSAHRQGRGPAHRGSASTRPNDGPARLCVLRADAEQQRLVRMRAFCRPVCSTVTRPECARSRSIQRSAGPTGAALAAANRNSSAAARGRKRPSGPCGSALTSRTRLVDVPAPGGSAASRAGVGRAGGDAAALLEQPAIGFAAGRQAPLQRRRDSPRWCLAATRRGWRNGMEGRRKEMEWTNGRKEGRNGRNGNGNGRTPDSRREGMDRFAAPAGRKPSRRRSPPAITCTTSASAPTTMERRDPAPPPPRGGPAVQALSRGFTATPRSNEQLRSGECGWAHSFHANPAMP